jgi:hypothetical protein
MRLHHHLTAALLLSTAAAAQEAGPPLTPPGEPESTMTRALEAGSTLLQRDAPPDQLDVYIVGFHPMAENPQMQLEAHHFCRQVNQDFAQCALYDGNTKDANLTGIEYIISERLFSGLPAEEKQYWHPHNGEILSGQLVAPGIPAVAEKELMRTKINSYGKTWHTWNTGHAGMPGDRLPLGEPHLAWSFSREGEIRPGLTEERDRRLGISTARVREGRQDLVPLAKPQAGVDRLNGRFDRPTQPIPGVVDAARP